MYRKTQRFIGISRFIDIWATISIYYKLNHKLVTIPLYSVSNEGFHSALAPYNGSVFFEGLRMTRWWVETCSPNIYKPRYTNKSLCLTVRLIPYFTASSVWNHTQAPTSAVLSYPFRHSPFQSALLKLWKWEWTVEKYWTKKRAIECWIRIIRTTTMHYSFYICFSN
jgi:hypothetical protein